MSIIQTEGTNKYKNSYIHVFVGKIISIITKKTLGDRVLLQNTHGDRMAKVMGSSPDRSVFMICN